MKRYCPNCLKLNNQKSKTCFNCKKDLLLNNQYFLTEILGENSGKTYLSLVGVESNSTFDTSTLLSERKLRHRKVVIKELSIKKMNKWKEEELFQRERLTLSNLKHKFIPKFIDKFDIKKGKRLNYYTVIEYIDGENFKRYIKNKKFKDNEVIEFLKNMSDILDYIHSFTPPIIHRDIKPSNIIIRDNEFYLIDFGSVTNIIKEEGGSTIAGTFGYMAPEQFLGKANAATDYYALGIIAIEMLSNKTPEDFLDNHSVNWDKLKVSKKMKEIISKLLNYNYKNRVNCKEDLLFLLSPPAKERQFDIINILNEYNEINKLHKKSIKISPLDYLYFLIGIGITIPITKKTAIGAIIFAFAVLLAYAFNYHQKAKRIIKKKVKSYSNCKHRKLETKVFAMTLFCEYNPNKVDKKLYYKLLDEKLASVLNLDKSLEYNKAFKDESFIPKHINKLEKYGEAYIFILKEKLKDENNNSFNISNKEIEDKINYLKEIKEGFYSNTK